jgi:hypothetical protein
MAQSGYRAIETRRGRVKWLYLVMTARKQTDVSVVSEELLRGSSVLKAPLLVRHVVSFCTAFVPKHHLWQLPYVVSVNCAGRPAFGTERSREDNPTVITARAAVRRCSAVWLVQAQRGAEHLNIRPVCSTIFPLQLKPTAHCVFLPYLTMDTLTVTNDSAEVSFTVFRLWHLSQKWMYADVILSSYSSQQWMKLCKARGRIIL